MQKQSLLFSLPMLAIALSNPASALPIEGRIGIGGMIIPNYAGVEGEVGVKGTPFRIGGTVLAFADNASTQNNQQAISCWGQYTHHLSKNISLGMLIGANSFPFYLFARVPVGASNQIPDSQRLGLLAGVSCTLHNDQYWLRIHPNSVFFSNGSGLLSSGIPLLEVGTKVTPSLDLSLRLALMPITLSWEF